MTLRVDNQAALRRTSNEVEDGLTRYLATRHMYVRVKVASGEIQPEWIETKENIVDIFTKSLGGKYFYIERRKKRPASRK
jgi:hypothetical protein